MATTLELHPALLAVLVIVVAFLLSKLKEGYQVRKFFRDKPGPPHHPIFGHILNIAELFKLKLLPVNVHPHSYVVPLMKRHKLERLFYMDNWPLGPSQLIIADPEIAQQVTVQRSLDKHPYLDEFVAPIGGPDNIVGANGAVWKKWRSVFNPGFSVQNLMGMVPEIVDDGEMLVKVLGGIADSGDVFRLEDVMTRFTVNVIGRVAMDLRLGALESDHLLVDAFRSQVRWLPNLQTVNPFDKYNPARPYMLWRNQRIMSDWLGKELDKRFANIDINDEKAWKKKKFIVDLALKQYIAGAKEEGKIVTGLDSEFRQSAITQMLVFIFAGHDTSSSTLCYIFHLLSKHPKVLAKLRAEHDEIFGKDLSKTANMIREDPHIISKMHYTNAVMKEALRLYPAASTIRNGEPGFNITDPVTGIAYPTEGCLVWVASHSIHRRPDLWAQPDDFIPERFLPESTNTPLSPVPNAWRPFEKGPRNCIGQELAVIEVKIALALTARKFGLKSALDDPTWEERVVGFDGRKGDRGWDGPATRTSGIDNIDGDKLYQVLLGTAKPREGMPALCTWVK